MKVSIGEAAKRLGVSIPTLRRWEFEGKIQSERTVGKHRRYDLDSFSKMNDPRAAPPRVARLYGSRSHKNKKILKSLHEVAHELCR